MDLAVHTKIPVKNPSHAVWLFSDFGILILFLQDQIPEFCPPQDMCPAKGQW